MVVQDLWFRRDGVTPTKRHGRGLRFRVVVDGYPATSCRTRREADLLNARRIAAGPPAQRDVVLVGELVERWLEGKRGLSPKGYEAARLAAAHVLERWRHVQVDEVDPMEVQAWLAGLRVPAIVGRDGAVVTPERPASASLRAKVLQCIRGALRGRVDLGAVTTRPQRRREARYLTAPELLRLAACRPGAETMILLLGTTGLRVGECVALNVGDVDVRRRRVRVRTAKSGCGRDVPVPQFVLDMLDLGRAADAPLFTSPQGGRVNVTNWRAREWRPAVEAFGMPDMRVHDLRHVAASLAIASGADVLAVSRMLGHKSPKMTLDTYAELWDEGLDVVASRMDRMLAGYDVGTKSKGDSLHRF